MIFQRFFIEMNKRKSRQQGLSYIQERKLLTESLWNGSREPGKVI